MQGDKRFYSRKVMPPLSCEAGGLTYDAPIATLQGPKLSGPFHGVELRALDVCPRNFLIFDRIASKRQMMFHPAVASDKFDDSPFIVQEAVDENSEVNCDVEESSTFKENTDDIDALLSLDKEDEDEEVSSAGTMVNYRCRSLESHSTSSSRTSKLRPSIQKNSPCSSSSSSAGSRSRIENKRKQKLLLALRGIVPGGGDMDNVTVIDEAVKYLESLKTEVKKLGACEFRIN